jgi:hypothetical protein
MHLFSRQAPLGEPGKEKEKEKEKEKKNLHTSIERKKCEIG